MKNKMVKILRWSEKYINTNMVYAVHGAFWLLLWKGIGMITSIVLLAGFAKWTPKEVYGGYNYILSMIVPCMLEEPRRRALATCVVICCDR